MTSIGFFSKVLLDLKSYYTLDELTMHFQSLSGGQGVGEIGGVALEWEEECHVCSNSWIFRGESDGSEGSNWGSCSEAWVITQDWYSYHISPTAGSWEIVTCSEPREWRSSCALRGIPLAKPAWFGSHGRGQIPVVLMEIFPTQGPVLLLNGQPPLALKHRAHWVPIGSVPPL